MFSYNLVRKDRSYHRQHITSTVALHKFSFLCFSFLIISSSTVIMRNASPYSEIILCRLFMSFLVTTWINDVASRFNSASIQSVHDPKHCVKAGCFTMCKAFYIFFNSRTAHALGEHWEITGLNQNKNLINICLH